MNSVRALKVAVVIALAVALPAGGRAAAHPPLRTSFAAANSSAGARAQPVAPLEGICDATGVLDVLGDLGDPSTAKKREQIALLQGRIVDCSRKLAAARSASSGASPAPYWALSPAAPAPAATPSDACTNPPPATSASDRFALFEVLQRCSAYWAALNPPTTPAASPTALPSLASRPTFYVFATGAVDAASATVLIRSLVKRLADAHSRAATDDVVIAGRADWTTTESYTSQCQLDPNTRGALVVETSIPATYRRNYFLLVANFSTVAASIELLGCGAEDHRPDASPLSLFADQSVTGAAHEDALTLGIFSSIAAYLATDKSRTTVTTGNGTTTVSRSDSTAPALTGSVLGYFEGENLNLPAQNPSVQLTVAGQRFAGDALSRLRAACGDPRIRELAGRADPKNVPAPPRDYRTAPYKAAFEYVTDCALFADFGR